MNAKLIRYTVYLTIFPVSGVLWAVVLRYNSNAALPVLLLLAALQLSVLLLCKRNLMSFIFPDLNVLEKMGIQYVPVLYQPGRCQMEARVCSVTVYLSFLPPILMWLACRFPETINVAGLDLFTYTAPNMTLMLLSLFLLFFGVLSLPIWFHAARAAAIFAQGSDKKRYMMRGFVDKLDERGGMSSYQSACKGIFLSAAEADDSWYWATR